MTVLLEYLSIGVRSVRVFQRSSVYQCTGCNYPNYSLIRTLLSFPENKGVRITEGLLYLQI